ncbi:MAG: hypothetical protein IJN63_06465 [Clostridia bacterium]|nr:hypothetical protein [Clostridia bacterium]
MDNVRVAICGKLDTAHAMLVKEGVKQIDSYSDALDLAYNIRSGEEYHLILVYSPQGEGLMDTEYSFGYGDNGQRCSVPVRLLNEPACHSALLELKSTVHGISKKIRETENSFS